MNALLLIWTDAAWHPSLAFTAQMLSERGYSVTVLYKTPPPDRRLPEGPDFGGETRLEGIGQGERGLRRRLNYFVFLLRALMMAKRMRPGIIIGYDLYGFAAAYVAGRLARGARLVYHNFDLVGNERTSSFVGLLKHLEAAGSRRADAVIVSSAGRAGLLKQSTRMTADPQVVMNCQRLSTRENRTGELETILRTGGLRFERIVVRLGFLTPGNAIETIIHSVIDWPRDVGLVLAGAAYESFLTRLQEIVAALGLQERVLILPLVSQSLWYDCLYAANLGLALYEPNNVNNQTMAGAGNKLNLYLKAGIPSLVPDLPDFRSLLERFPCGRAVDPADAPAIAAAVCRLLQDAAEYEQCCAAARRAFQTEFNFEAQFGPVLERLLGERECVPREAVSGTELSRQ